MVRLRTVYARGKVVDYQHRKIFPLTVHFGCLHARSRSQATAQIPEHFGFLPARASMPLQNQHHRQISGFTPLA